MKPSPKKRTVKKKGLIFHGFRVHGKTYAPDGTLISEKHEADCFCCRDNIFRTKKQS